MHAATISRTQLRLQSFPIQCSVTFPIHAHSHNTDLIQAARLPYTYLYFSHMPNRDCSPTRSSRSILAALGTLLLDILLRGTHTVLAALVGS